MSKIIIHNESRLTDSLAVARVYKVIQSGFISGEKQYCWCTRYPDCDVLANKTRGRTHTFKVKDRFDYAYVKEQHTDGL